MKKKVIPIIAAIAGLTLLFAGAGFANVPAPPVNQSIGFDDHTFNNLVEADCRGCHSGIPDRHHMLYGSTMPVGECSASARVCNDNPSIACSSDADCDNSSGTNFCLGYAGGACYNDGECAAPWDICNMRGNPCTDASDCSPSYLHQECGQPFCSGSSAAPNNPNAGIYGCLSCHDQDTSGGVTNFIVYRDCTICHSTAGREPSPHHLDEAGTGAKAGECVACHGDVVDNKDDGHYVPTYPASLVTPEPSHYEDVCSDTGDPCEVDDNCTAPATCIEVATVGTCAYCHDAGTDTASGVEVVTSYDTHHGSGVYRNRYGGTADSAICGWCHKGGSPHGPGGHDADRIRNCENCHGPESLHNIQADSPNAANIGTIVVGAEDGGYGHVGANNPGGEDDCWGCHGFSMASAPDTGPIVPSISSASVGTISAGTDTPVTLSGSSFTNDAYTSNVVLTAEDGSTVQLEPDAISVGSLTVTIPGTVSAGTYQVRAAKDNVQSNPVVIIINPAVAISSTVCGACTGVTKINGSGFGDAPPEGAQDFLNVMADGLTLEIISWTDTQIKVQGGCNSDSITVNALSGSATK